MVNGYPAIASLVAPAGGAGGHIDPFEMPADEERPRIEIRDPPFELY